MKVCPELDVLARAELGRLSEEHKIKQPVLSWEPVKGIASFSPLGIALSEHWDRLFREHPEEVKIYLPAALAHEFRHYMTPAKWMKIPLPKGTKWKLARSEYEERVAREFSEAETGVSDENLKAWWRARV